jgi:predicted aspartyl protease
MRPAVGETVQLERTQHGTYTISVQINGALVLPFVLDTGASLVVIPEDVFRTLSRTGTVTKSDFIGTGTAVLADGSKHASDSYVLHEAPCCMDQPSGRSDHGPSRRYAMRT